MTSSGKSFSLGTLLILVCALVVLAAQIAWASSASLKACQNYNGPCTKPKPAKTKRQLFTVQEEKEYQKCRAERKANGYSMKQFYLIPKYTANCENSVTNAVDMTEFSLTNSDSDLQYLKFPGCYDIDAHLNINRNHPVMRSWVPGKTPNIVAKLDWSYLSLGDDSIPLFNDFSCKDQDTKGCGGYGNGCYYCDFCETVEQIQDNAETPATCPVSPTKSRLTRKNVCWDDWGDMDEDNDGEPDFICYPDFKPFRAVIEDIGIQGFGNVKTTVTLASNDTVTYKEHSKYCNPCGFQEWHRAQLPKMVVDKSKQIVCTNVFFDICDRKPIFEPALDQYVCPPSGDE